MPKPLHCCEELSTGHIGDTSQTVALVIINNKGRIAPRGFLGSNPSSATYILSDLGQDTELSVLLFLHL